MSQTKTTTTLLCLAGMLAASFFLNSCKYLGLGTTQDPVEVATDKAKNDQLPAEAASPEALELKISKLWAMHDELAEQVQVQKQRLAVLEKGLMLGIIPEELKMEGDRHQKAEDTSKVKKESKNKKTNSPAPVVISEVPAPEENTHENVIQDNKPMTPTPLPQIDSATSEKPRHEKLQEAQRLFEQGQYGRALAIYSTVDDGSDGSHHYWMGLCWYKLKELSTAKSEFETLLKVAPASALIPRAKYQLAKIDFELGFREKALAQLRQIVESYPNEDAAQMARTTLQSMESQL